MLMPKRPIEKTLDAFQLKDLQTFKTILHTLAVDDWSVADAIEHVNYRLTHRGGPVYLLRRKCPQCKVWLRLHRVNKDPGNMIGGDWKSQWSCAACEWEEFTTKEVQEEGKPYLEEVQNGNR
jgi:hypothetical protein